MKKTLITENDKTMASKISLGRILSMRKYKYIFSSFEFVFWSVVVSLVIGCAIFVYSASKEAEKKVIQNAHEIPTWNVTRSKTIIHYVRVRDGNLVDTSYQSLLDEANVLAGTNSIVNFQECRGSTFGGCEVLIGANIVLKN